MRQQQTHQQNTNQHPKPTRSAHSTTTSRNGQPGNNNKSSNKTSSTNTNVKLESTSNAPTTMSHNISATTTIANNGNHTITGHNSSPVLPVTPTSSISPPANVICKQELSNSYNGLNAGLGPVAYSNINARLGHGGNSTPLGSNSSVITTPSPPITPSQNGIYMPNQEYSFWPPHSHYQQYGPNAYNTPSSYYSQVDYQSQPGYGMSHSGYSAANMSLAASGNSFNGAMTSQPFSSNGLDYMSSV